MQQFILVFHRDSPFFYVSYAICYQYVTGFLFIFLRITLFGHPAMVIKKQRVRSPFHAVFFPRLEWLILQAFGLLDDLRQLLGARFFACDLSLALPFHARLTQAAQLTLSGIIVRFMS